MESTKRQKNPGTGDFQSLDFSEEEFASLGQTSLELAESLEQNRWLENGKKIKVEITESETIGVDTLEDLEKVRKIIASKTK